MAPAEDINFNKGHDVLNVTVGSLVCMMCLAVLGLKLRWFRHRMHIAEAPSVQTLPAFTGSYRQCIDIDGFDFQRPLNTQATTPYPTNSIKHIGNSNQNHLRPKSSDTAIVHTNPLPKSQYEQVPPTNNSITSSKAELKLPTVTPSVPPRAVKNTTPLPNTRRTGLFGRGKKSENITKKTDKKTEAKTKENNKKLSDQSSATNSIAAAQNSVVYDGYEEPVQLRMKDKVIVSNESRNNVLPRSLPPNEHKITEALVDNRTVKSVDDSYVSFDQSKETSIPTTGGTLFETVKIKDNTNHSQYKNPPEYMNYNNPIAVNTRGGDSNIDFGDDNDSYLNENHSDGFGSWDIVEQHRRSIAVTPIMANKISKDAAGHHSKHLNKQSLHQQRATLKNDFDDSEA